MGRKTRKTRWRTLPIADEQSDSEESVSKLDNSTRNGYHHQKYYNNNNKFTYSSQSTPIRRYQNGDGGGSTKSTRSSSTTSENKITFNEDEYMRITTPRQDVLFKKGYLNKPKTYSTQTSTGNSTTSTGNSTGNDTPDYHGTDLEYESQYVFPNGFMDQNGIYYINSYDPYPLMVYNPPTYYNGNDYRTKKYSTESLTDTNSTTNEENCQEVVSGGGGIGSNGETIQTPSPSNGHHQQLPSTTTATTTPEYNIYNMVYPPPFYYNGLCTTTTTTATTTNSNSTNTSQELVNGHHQTESKRIKRRRRQKVSSSKEENGTTSEYTDDEDDEEENGSTTTNVIVETNHHLQEVPSSQTNGDNEKGCDNDGISDSSSNEHHDLNQTNHTADNNNELSLSDKKYDLKPDAQEFVPRSMRPENLQQQQYFKIPPNFVPVPLMNPLGAQNFNHAYIPSGIPINFIQQYPPGFLPPGYGPSPTNQTATFHHETHTEDVQHQMVQNAPEIHNIDIETVVSKLEEVASNEPPQKSDKKPFKKNGYYQKKPYQTDQPPSSNNEKKEQHQKREKEIEQAKDVRKINHSTTLSPRKFNNNARFSSGTPKSPKKYSETVKKSVQIPQTSRKTATSNQPVSPEVNSNTLNATPRPQQPPQWIPVVSNKKKRRNRNVEEVDDFEEPSSTTIVGGVKENEIKMLEVSELEKELLNNVNNVELEVRDVKEVEPKNEIRETQTSNETKPKKKTKKNGTNKIQPKRVMIIDSLPELDTSSEEIQKTEIPTETTKNPVENSKVPDETEISIETSKDSTETSKDSPETSKVSDETQIQSEPLETSLSSNEILKDSIVTEITETVPLSVDLNLAPQENVEKKSKKKKKKSKLQDNLTSPISCDDTYNFLGNSDEKTNMEVSQELDLMIQRGMYSNLEEKIKSLNIIPVKEEFFQTVIRPTTTSRESSIEKTPDMTKLLANSMPKFKYCMASVGNPDNDESSDVKQLTTSKNGLFVENLEVNELLNDIYGKKEKTPPIPTLQINSELPQKEEEEQETKEKYPITLAVKNWMTKTRENTPEVEILKSPSTIFRELRKSISEDDDVTVYSASASVSATTSRHNSDTADLLECWENEITTATSCNDVEDSDEKQHHGMKENDDVLVYESKYGQNADYLEIQKEIEEKKRNFPKHGALPYRAICCSIM